jgi:hypothetical protein
MTAARGEATDARELAKTWQGRLPVEDMLGVAASFDELLEARDEAPLCIGHLADGRSIDAPTLADLRSVLAGVTDDEVTQLSIGVGDPASTQIWLAREPDWSRSSASRSATRLKITGVDEARAGAAFERLDHTITARLLAFERAEQQRIAEAAQRAKAEADAKAEAKAAASRASAEKVAAERPWWDPWVVGIAGGVLAAVVVGVALGLIVH